MVKRAYVQGLGLDPQIFRVQVKVSQLSMELSFKVRTWPLSFRRATLRLLESMEWQFFKEASVSRTPCAALKLFMLEADCDFDHLTGGHVNMLVLHAASRMSPRWFKGASQMICKSLREV